MGQAYHRECRMLLLIGAGALALSGLNPYDGPTWWLEVAPVLVAIPLLVATHRRFPLTQLSYRLIFLHAMVLLLGAHYTYSRVPLGFWAMDLLHLARNHYDRVGHFMQGFTPAVLAREILLRTSPLRPGKWLAFLVLCVCVAISAWYELFEWWTALVLGVQAEYFLATQGDPWDTQWDMFLAFIGAAAALAGLSRIHDDQMGAFLGTDGRGRVARREISAGRRWGPPGRRP